MRSTRNESGQLPQFTGYGPALAKCRHGATACKRPLMRWKSSDRGDTLLDGGFLDRKENVGAGVRQSWVGQVPSFERVGIRPGCDARAEMHFHQVLAADTGSVGGETRSAAQQGDQNGEAAMRGSSCRSGTCNRAGRIAPPILFRLPFGELEAIFPDRSMNIFRAGETRLNVNSHALVGVFPSGNATCGTGRVPLESSEKKRCLIP